MFYYVEGVVTHLEKNLAVVDCAGVGYALNTSQVTIGQLTPGQKAKLYTYLHVREDIMDLYGFSDVEERNFFLKLIGVSGVGPRVALNALSIAPYPQLVLAIVTGDEKTLTSAPGIGKKTAQRLVLELRDKIAKEQTFAPVPEGVGFDAPSDGGALGEALEALCVLGYSRSEALGALGSLDAGALTSEEMVKAALKNLVRIG